MKVDTSAKIPIKMWLDGVTESQGWDDCMDQFRNVANLPVATKWVAAMPDAHLGFGMPIGGVLATEGAVVIGAIGVDIGCGMLAARFDIEAASISKEQLQAIRMAIHARVPVGGGGGRKTRGGQARAKAARPGWHKEPQPWERLPAWPSHLGSIVVQEFEKARLQIGTLGGGNHFIELQVDEAGKLWVMLHSGSRNVGLRVANHYVKVAQQFCRTWYTPLADDKLAFLVRDVPEYKAYMDQMNWCLKFAEVSRAMMLDATIAAIQEVSGTPVSLTDRITLQLDTHHNFAAMENHYGKNLLVHRKGAVKASGLVTIPGSMQTASYIGMGLEPAESFNTCSHGAGRAMSRTVANAKFDLAFAQDAMKDVVFNVRDGDFDELGDAYKDIDVIMEAQKDLVRPEYRLTPIAVVKG